MIYKNVFNMSYILRQNMSKSLLLTDYQIFNVRDKDISRCSQSNQNNTMLHASDNELNPKYNCVD